jgi:hypothetical protein
VNRSKLRAAEKVTDVVVAGWNEAQFALRTLWVDGAGVLTDPSMVRSDLATAAAAIKRAQAAMDGFHAWPTDADYD